MATQVQTNGKGGKPAPVVAAKGGKQGDKPTEPAKVVVPILKAGALSTDVGPFVVKNWHQANIDEDKAKELMASAASKRYDLLAQLTAAIVKAAKSDKTIDLTATVKGGPEGTKAMALLNDQLYLALGIKHVVTVGKGDKAVPKLAYAPSVASFFPSASDDKSSIEAKRKATLRSNLSHSVKKCAMAALGIIERGINATVDKKAGTLLLSGPAIKKEFGQDKVHLNERQTIDGKKEGEKIELKQKPSFTAIADLAAKSHGKDLRRGTNTRGRGGPAGSGTTLIDPVKALEALASSVVKACEAIKQPNDKQIDALEKMQNAIEKVLDNRE